MSSNSLLAPRKYTDGEHPLAKELPRPNFQPKPPSDPSMALRTITLDGHGNHLDRQTLYGRPHDTALTPAELCALRTKATPPALNINSPEYAALVRKTFAELFSRASINLDDTTAERVRCAYRIVREMARSKRLVAIDEPLISSVFAATPGSIDMWTMPTETPQIAGTHDYLTKPDTTASTAYLQLCADALRLREDYWPWSITNHIEPNDPADDPDTADHYDPNATQHFTIPEQPITIRAGLPLLPPPVPLKFHTNTGEITDLYSPENDPGLYLYVRAVDTIADYLGVYYGSEADPESGRRGMIGLANAKLTRLAFPTRMQLISWEYLLITETLKCMTNKGVAHAHKWLQHKYGFNHIEVNGVLRMAKRFARDLVNAERAEDRAIMLLRCEEMMKRARGALDLKAEHNAMKQMSMILGLTRTEEDETLSDFVAVVKDATKKRMATNAARKMAAPKDDKLFDMTPDGE